MHLQPSKVLDRTLRRLSRVDEGPLLARNRHADAIAACPLLGEQRTWLCRGSKTEFDPFETFPQWGKCQGLLSRRFYLLPDHNAATFLTVKRAFEGARRNGQNIPIHFVKADLVGSCPSLVP